MVIVKAINLGRNPTIHTPAHGYVSYNDGLTFRYFIDENGTPWLYRALKYGAWVKKNRFRSQNHEKALADYLNKIAFNKKNKTKEPVTVWIECT